MGVRRDSRTPARRSRGSRLYHRVVAGIADGPSAWVTFLLLAILHTSYAVAEGVTRGGDTARFEQWADRLRDGGFDYKAIDRPSDIHVPAILHTGFLSLVAGLRELAGDHWDEALVAVNVVAVAAAGALLIRLVAQVTRSAAGRWLALALFCGCAEILVATPYLLSDSTFLLVSLAVFWIGARHILIGGARWLALIEASALAALFRPTGVVLLVTAPWLLYLAWSARGRRSHRRTVVGVIAVLTGAGAVAFARVMERPSRWPFTALDGAVRATARTYADGQVVSGRPETYHAAPSSLLDHLAIAGDRLLHFFLPAPDSFSQQHIAAQYAFYVPVYLLTAVLVVGLLRHRVALPRANTSVYWAAIGTVAAYAVFHALVGVDADWRGRLPVLPLLVLLAAGGVAYLCQDRRILPATER